MNKFNICSYTWSCTKHEDLMNCNAFCTDLYTFHIFLKGTVFRCRNFYKL